MIVKDRFRNAIVVTEDRLAIGILHKRLWLIFLLSALSVVLYVGATYANSRSTVLAGELALAQGSISKLSVEADWVGAQDDRVLNISVLPDPLYIAPYLQGLESIDATLFQLEAIELNAERIQLTVTTGDSKLESLLSVLNKQGLYQGIQLREAVKLRGGALRAVLTSEMGE